MSKTNHITFICGFVTFLYLVIVAIIIYYMYVGICTNYVVKKSVTLCT